MTAFLSGELERTLLIRLDETPHNPSQHAQAELEAHDELFNKLSERMPRELLITREMMQLSLGRL